MQFTASVDSISQSDLYLTVKAVMFTVPEANLNGCRCTEAFLDEIVQNEGKYVCLPLNCDVRNLSIGNYKRLGHMYNQRTGEFKSTMIGSFYQFEKEDLGNGTYALVGYARVPKRNKNICSAICQLFTQGNLKFSFQVNCANYNELEDGTIEIDAGEGNYIEGEAIVWQPACPEATALQLVAELEGSENAVNENEITASKVVVEATNVEVDEVRTYDLDTCEEHSVRIETVTTDRAIVETDDNAVETASQEVNASEEEVALSEANASLEEVASQEEKSTDEVVSAEQQEEDKASVEEVAQATQEEAPVEQEVAECKEEKEIAEEQVASVAEEKETAEEVPVEKEETASVNYAEIIAQLQSSIKTLRDEVAELKANRVVAEKQHNEMNINPFMAEISSPTSKYSLLEREEKVDRSYFFE